MVDELFETEVMSFYSKFSFATSKIQLQLFLDTFAKEKLNFKMISSPQIFIESKKTRCLKQR